MPFPALSRKTATAVAACAAVLAATGAAAVPGAATAASPPSIVKVTVTSKAVTFAHGTSLPAGRVVFESHVPKGDHTLQIVHLHNGYPLKKAGQDLNAAFGGDLKAINRVDTKIDWLGGADATPGHPGRFAVRLDPGSYIALDQNSNA